MAGPRSSVFVALSCAVGHELVFMHYTNKVVVGKYPDQKPALSPEMVKQKNRRKVLATNKKNPKI